MQHDLELILAAKAPERREIAIAAYDLACDVPEGADWQLIAEMLRLCIPNARKVKAPADLASIPEASPFAPWHSAPTVYSSALRNVETARFEIAFADGPTIRASAWRDKRGRWNVGQAVRAAVDLFRYKVCADANVAHVEVPEIVGITNTATGEIYDPAPANAETAEMRVAIVRVPKTSPDDQRHAVTQRLAWFDDPEWYVRPLADKRRDRRQSELEEAFPPIYPHPERVEVERVLAWFDTAGEPIDEAARDERRKDCKAVWPAIRKPKLVQAPEIAPEASTDAPVSRWRPSARFLSSTAIRVAA